jgi:chromosome partitioning protein
MPFRNDPAGGRFGATKTIAVVALKGGTGKTTIAVNMSVSAFLAGRKVILADTDPQGSSYAWSRARMHAGPRTIAIPSSAIFPTKCFAETSNADLIIIDSRASVKFDTVEAVRQCDLAIIVTRPTVIDLRAIRETVDLVKPLGKPAMFVMNQSPSQRAGMNTGFVLEAIQLLLSYGVMVAPVGIHSRRIYQTAFNIGQTPIEQEPDSAAAQETNNLWHEIEHKLWSCAKPRSDIMASSRLNPTAA